MIKLDKKWTDSIDFMELGRKLDVSAQSLGSAILFKDMFAKQAAEVNVHISECNESGYVKKESMQLVKDHINSLGGNLVYNLLGAGFESQIFVWNDSILEFSVSSPNYVSITVQSQKEKFVVNLKKFMKPHFQKDIQQGHVFAIVSHSGRLALNSIGNAGIQLVRHNYTPTVLKGYDYVIEDLNSSSPSGRISIMEGEPGTGKTHLVRAMLLDVPDAMFVLVSPDMVASLGGPELLPLLLSHHQNLKGPIILVLEDADKCLVTRAGDNINSIQSLLNLGDGILGSLLDLRIIATTNAKKLEMEAAILRPGRLSRRIEVGPLDLKTAVGIFNVLCPKTKLPKSLIKNAKVEQKFTLAEVYSLARKSGWKPKSNKDKAGKPAKDPRPAVYDESDDD